MKWGGPRRNYTRRAGRVNRCLLMGAIQNLEVCVDLHPPAPCQRVQQGAVRRREPLRPKIAKGQVDTRSDTRLPQRTVMKQAASGIPCLFCRNLSVRLSLGINFLSVGAWHFFTRCIRSPVPYPFVIVLFNVPSNDFLHSTGSHKKARQAEQTAGALCAGAHSGERCVRERLRRVDAYAFTECERGIARARGSGAGRATSSYAEHEHETARGMPRGLRGFAAKWKVACGRIVHRASNGVLGNLLSAANLQIIQ